MNILKSVIVVLCVCLMTGCRSHKSTVVRATDRDRVVRTVAGAAATKTRQKVRTSGYDSPAAPDPRRALDPEVAGALTKEARAWLGVPYRYGGDTRKGVDCSGFVSAVYLKVTDIKLPRSSAEQQAYCVALDRGSLRPGDLVFFSTSRRGSKVSHVGLYVGDGKMIHASTSRGVVESVLTEPYYESHYHSAGRVYAATVASPAPSPSTSPAPKKEAKSSKKKDKGSKTENQNTKKDTKKEVREMTLDEFIAKQGRKSSSRTVIATPADIVPAVADTLPAPPDSVVVVPVDARPVAVADSVPAKPAAPVLPSDTVATAPADSVARAGQIRQTVVNAMKFGK